MPFADFHVHGNFKSFFTGYTVEEKKSPWEEVHIGIDNFLFKKSNRVLNSQSCFRQLLDGDLLLAVIPLYSTERAFPDSFLLKLVDKFSSRINNLLFKDIRDKKISYWQQLNDCYHHLLRAKTDNVPGHELVNFTRCFEDIIPGKMNVVLSMEGSHCFLDKTEDTVTPDGMNKLIARIKQYKQRNGDQEHPRVFILNLTHLTQAPFCNHAFGMKLISHDDFIPTGRGISPAGLSIIDAALHYDANEYPIIIDVKHMSVETRKEFYKIRRNNYNKVPVTASHAGCTGISWDRVNDYIEEINSPIFNKKKCNLISYNKPQGILADTEFNPWSINLYDEDIAEILSSGGLIGLSLDQRILGCGNIAREKMSKAETFEGITPDKPFFAKDPDEGKLTKDAELHFRHFCNTIFHITDVARRTLTGAVNPWKQIVIGSDFDGLIDAVDFCINAKEYGHMAEWIKTKMPAHAQEAGITLPADAAVIADDLLYNNAFSFLQKYYSKNSF